MRAQARPTGAILIVIASSPPTHAYQQVQPYLFTVAYRMTGSASDAEDLVQDAWIRYLDAGAPVVDSLRAWLTTAVSRLALDYLKSARVKREQYTGTWMPEPVLSASVLDGPEATVERREAVSIAFLLLLEKLTPEQRVVYVLREALGLPYEEIALHVGKSAAASRQIYHRAQGKLDGERRVTIAPEPEHRALAERFLEVVQTGDATRLAALLNEDVTVSGDAGPGQPALKRPLSGIVEVSRAVTGYTHALLATAERMRMSIIDLNGAPGLIGIDGNRLEFAVLLDIRGDGIAALRGVRAPRKLAWLARELGVEAPVDLSEEVTDGLDR
jgi:RNA polymerase sigma-70 factor (ECF subfamily)